jgi:hypothetical protein
VQSRKALSSTTYGKVRRCETGKHSAVQPTGKSGGAKSESTQQYNLRGGLEGQSRKALSSATFGKVRRCKTGRHSAVQPSGWSGGAKPESAQQCNLRGGLEGQSPSSCAAGATPPPQTQQISGALSAGKSGRKYYTLTKLISVSLYGVVLSLYYYTMFRTFCPYLFDNYMKIFLPIGAKWIS